jgi:hypothetical protein
MGKCHLAAMIPAAFVLALGSVQLPVWAAEDSGPAAGTDGYEELAFTLEEMNCFSSDVRAREATPDTEAPDILDLQVANSQGGTNGIPCSSRDPKAPPKKKRSRS